MTHFVELNKKISIASTGALQVFFVSLNVYFISYSLFLAVFATSFMISLIWSFNVKKIAFGDLGDRISYALGAAIGSVCGLWLAKVLTTVTLPAW